MPNLHFNDLLSDGSDFAIERMHYSKNVNMNDSHFHRHYEILYIQTGKRNLKVNGSPAFSLSSNSIALLRPNTIHQTLSANDGNQSRILINISHKLISEFVRDYSQDIISCFNAPVLNLSTYHASMLGYFFAELLDNKKDSHFYHEKIKINLLKILLLLSEIYYSTYDENNISLNQSVKEYVDYTVEYFQKNFHSQLPMSEIAQKLFISETYLSRIFKQIMGMTPHKYLSNVRIINAKRLLESRTMSVSDVATACGFNNLVSFSRAFKQLQGCSPKEYQMNFKK